MINMNKEIKDLQQQLAEAKQETQHQETERLKQKIEVSYITLTFLVCRFSFPAILNTNLCNQ